MWDDVLVLKGPCSSSIVYAGSNLFPLSSLVYIYFSREQRQGDEETFLIAPRQVANETDRGMFEKQTIHADTTRVGLQEKLAPLCIFGLCIVDGHHPVSTDQPRIQLMEQKSNRPGSRFSNKRNTDQNTSKAKNKKPICYLHQ